MLETVLHYLHNYFIIRDEIVDDDFKIDSAGGITPHGNLKTNQYFMIAGSILNDGVHKYGDSDLVEEEFAGLLVPMRVPPALLSIVAEMEAWETNNANGVMTSENMSSSGYSYTKAMGSSGTPMTVIDVFAHKLRGWKKI